jgi:transposase
MYLPLYRMESLFERQGFRIARSTQSIWCGDVADLLEPLYQRMIEKVLASVKGRVKPGHCGGVKVGQCVAAKLLDLRGRRASGA